MPRTASNVVILALWRGVSRIASVYASPTISTLSGVEGAGNEPEEKPGSSGFWLKLVISCGLVLAGGVFAGCVLPSA